MRKDQNGYQEHKARLSTEKNRLGLYFGSNSRCLCGASRLYPKLFSGQRVKYAQKT